MPNRWPGSSLPVAVALLFLSAGSDAKAENCQLSKVASPPVTVTLTNRVMMDGSIHGEAGKFMIDTGSAFTLFDSTVQKHFNISESTVAGYGYGVGGRHEMSRATIPDLMLGEYKGGSLPLWISATHFLGNGAYALIGEDLLSNFDLDIDLAKGKFELFEHYHCKAEPIYWADRFSEANISTNRDHHIIVLVEVNGVAARAYLDTGAPRTIVSWPLAHRLGLDKDSPGMEHAGTTYGIDRHPMDEYSYRFAELGVGDEVVKNPVLRITDLFHREHDWSSAIKVQDSNDTQVDLLLGADFMKSHHIFVARDQGKLYFTYNGGGIFSPPQEETSAAPEH